MLDLCCGRKGASSAMSDRGWHVDTLDIDARFHPTFTTDVRGFRPPGKVPYDLIWASPPCQEFSRHFFPWLDSDPPDMSIVIACFNLIFDVKPKYWIIENVKGSVPHISRYLGKPAWVRNPWYLWGFFPPIGEISTNFEKQRFCDPTRKAEIPYELSKRVAQVIEIQEPFDFHCSGAGVAVQHSPVVTCCPSGGDS